MCLRIRIGKHRKASVWSGSGNGQKCTLLGRSIGDAINGSLNGPDQGAANMKYAASIDSAEFPYPYSYTPDVTSLSLMILLFTNMYQSDLIPPPLLVRPWGIAVKRILPNRGEEGCVRMRSRIRAEALVTAKKVMMRRNGVFAHIVIQHNLPVCLY